MLQKVAILINLRTFKTLSQHRDILSKVCVIIYFNINENCVFYMIKQNVLAKGNEPVMHLILMHLILTVLIHTPQQQCKGIATIKCKNTN